MMTSQRAGTALYVPGRAAPITAREPQGLGWIRGVGIRTPMGDAAPWLHEHTGVQALSSLIITELPKSGGMGPTWHVSFSQVDGARLGDMQIRFARCAFDVLTAEEDNHHPGRARHFFVPVDPNERVACECKVTEVQVVESDGYRWSNDPKNCRGCDLERSMRAVGKTRPCSLHPRTTGDSAVAALPSHGETP